MREIKFRAWDTVNKMWLKITGFETHNSDDKTASINTGLSGMFHDGDYIGTFQKHGGEQNNVILMQYTGLKDVNGAEIYEGDIVKSTFSGIDGISTVYSDMKHSPFNRTPSTPFSVNLYPSGECCIWRHAESHDVKIIGNIYENPETLEVSNNV